MILPPCKVNILEQVYLTHGPIYPQTILGRARVQTLAPAQACSARCRHRLLSDSTGTGFGSAPRAIPAPDAAILREAGAGLKTAAWKKPRQLCRGWDIQRCPGWAGEVCYLIISILRVET